MSTTTKELLLHLYEANKIYRSTDFDFDGRSDNVGFAVGNVTIFQRENMAENKFFGKCVVVMGISSIGLSIIYQYRNIYLLNDKGCPRFLISLDRRTDIFHLNFC